MRLWFLESWWYYNWKQQTKDIISFSTEMANGDGTNWTHKSYYHNAWQTNIHIRGGLSHTGIIFGTDLANGDERNGKNRSPIRYPEVLYPPYTSPQPVTDRHPGWSVACVASVFSASSLRKLKREQKKKKGRMGRGSAEKETSPPPSSLFVLANFQTNSSRNACYAV